MKKLPFIVLAGVLALPLATNAQGASKIGTIDMQRAFKEYTKTKDAEVKINEAKNAAKKEYDDRADAYKKALDEINRSAEKTLTIEGIFMPGKDVKTAPPLQVRAVKP